MQIVIPPGMVDIGTRIIEGLVTGAILWLVKKIPGEVAALVDTRAKAIIKPIDEKLDRHLADFQQHRADDQHGFDRMAQRFDAADASSEKVLAALHARR